MQSTDLSSVESIHRTCYPNDHDSSRLPPNLLEDYYRCCLADNAFCYVATADNEQVIGFLIAGERIDEAIRRFRRRNAISLIVAVLGDRRLFDAALRNLVLSWRRRLTTSLLSTSSRVKALSMAVRSDRQRQGVARQLIAALHESLLVAEHVNYSVSVRKSNGPSNAFFEQIGARRVAETSTSSRYRVDLMPFRTDARAGQSTKDGKLRKP